MPELPHPGPTAIPPAPRGPLALPGWAVVAVFAMAAITAVPFLSGPWLWTGWGLAGALVLLAAADLRDLRLPDLLTLPLLLAGLAVAAWLDPDMLADRAVAAGIGWGGLALVKALYRRLRGRDGLGLGDAKLLGAIGAWTGLAALPWVLFLGAASALLVTLVLAAAGRVRDPGRVAVPFGAFLALAGWLVFLWGAGVTAPA